MTLSGIDVSHHQGPVDWPKVRATGVAFAVAKVSESTGNADPRFPANVAGAHANGILIGGYHFGRPGPDGARDDALAEAHHFLDTLRTAQPVDFVVLDIEDDTVPPGRKLDAWVRSWLDEVERVTGKIPWLYSYAPYWREHGSADPVFRRHPWWLADYSPPPAVVAPWGGYDVWQFTSSGTMPGVAGRCDLDRFDGSLDDFHRLLGGTTAPQPAPAAATTASQEDDPMALIPSWAKRQPNGRWPAFDVTDRSASACTVTASSGAPFAPGLAASKAPKMTPGSGFGLSTLRVEGLTSPPRNVAEAPDGTIALVCADGSTFDVARKP